VSAIVRKRERKPDHRIGSLAADAGARWEGGAGIEEAMMQTEIPTLVGFAKTPWNKGRLIGQKRPLKPRDVWAIRPATNGSRSCTRMPISAGRGANRPGSGGKRKLPALVRNPQY
jgi:hypothetical protein